MRLLAPLALLLLLSGCAFHGSRGDLSGAMEQSAAGGGGKTGDRSGRSEPTSGGWVASLIDGLVQSAFAEDGGRDSHGELADWNDDHWALPVDVAYLAPLGGDMQGITRFTVTPLALEGRDHFAGFYVGGGWVDFRGGTLPDRAVARARILELGLSFRRYLKDPEVFVSPYLAGNVGWQPLFWDYRHPVSDGGDLIESDRLHGITGYVGIGVAFGRGEGLSLFGEAGVGGTAYGRRTSEGFRNDVFQDFGYVALKLGVTARF